MIPSLEGWPTKAKEAPSPQEVRLAPLDTNPIFQCLGGNISVFTKKIRLLKFNSIKKYLLLLKQQKIKKNKTYMNETMAEKQEQQKCIVNMFSELPLTGKF